MNTSKFRILLAPILLLLIWQILSSLQLFSSYLLPSPFKVLNSFIHLCSTGTLFIYAGTSLVRVFSGFIISSLLGITTAFLLNRYKELEEFFCIPLSFMRMIPPLAMTPLLILWIGIGSTTQIVIIILASFFPIFLNARDGLKRITIDQKELARSLNLTERQYSRYILFPAAIPSIVTGTRLAFGYSWRALIGAELIAASSGLGYMIIDAQGMQRSDEVIVGILTIGLLGWILDNLFYKSVVRLLGRRFPEVRD